MSSSRAELNSSLVIFSQLSINLRTSDMSDSNFFRSRTTQRAFVIGFIRSLPPVEDCILQCLNTVMIPLESSGIGIQGTDELVTSSQLCLLRII